MGGHDTRLPIALVVGSLVIGAAIYFGLRHRPGGSAPAPAPAPAAAPAPIVVPPVVGLDPEQVRQQAQAALDAAREELARACWTEPTPGAPESITLEYDVTFDPGGQIVMLAIGEDREANRPEVARCVRALPRPALSIAPPGQTTRVQLLLRLPYAVPRSEPR